MNTLGSLVFELCCGQTDKVTTNRQTDSKILPTPTDIVGVGNEYKRMDIKSGRLKLVNEDMTCTQRIGVSGSEQMGKGKNEN